MLKPDGGANIGILTAWARVDGCSFFWGGGALGGFPTSLEAGWLKAAKKAGVPYMLLGT